MADDGIGLLERLGIERAHVAGASMGGMIAQTMAARHPDRVMSLASIMANTGHRWKGMPGLRVYPIFMRRPADNREGAVESTVSTFRLIGSPGFPFEEDELRRVAQLSYERGYNPAGTARQLAAILAAGDRAPELRRISAPTVVIHGTRDRMVRPSGGRETAKAISGARLVEIEGMGHDLPPGVWGRIIDAVVSNIARADASSRTPPPRSLRRRGPHDQPRRRRGAGPPPTALARAPPPSPGGRRTRTRPVRGRRRLLDARGASSTRSSSPAAASPCSPSAPAS